jgi:hypothetical protein
VPAAITAAAIVLGLAASAGSASAAAPGWDECVKLPKVGKTSTGAFADRHCSHASASHTGSYELEPISGPVSFAEGHPTPTGPKKHGGFSAVWRLKGHERELRVPCPYGAVSGELLPPDRVAQVQIEIGPCENGQGEIHSPGERGDQERPVRIGPLSGELGYLNSSTGEVGLDLNNETEPGGPLTVARTEFWVSGEGQFNGPRGIFGSMIAVVGAGAGTSRHLSLTLPVSTYLGLLPEQKINEGITVLPYEPLTNPPALEGGEQDVLMTEIPVAENYAFPLGLEAAIVAKTGRDVVLKTS